MSVDLCEYMLGLLRDERQSDELRAYALKALRHGDIDDELAAKIADAIECRLSAGRRKKVEEHVIVDRVKEALKAQSQARRKKTAALHEAAIALGVSYSTVRTAWRNHECKNSD